MITLVTIWRTDERGVREDLGKTVNCLLIRNDAHLDYDGGSKNDDIQKDVRDSGKILTGLGGRFYMIKTGGC